MTTPKMSVLSSLVAAKKLTPQERREVLALAECSPNTLDRWLRELPMKPTVKARIDRAWKKVRG